MFTQCSQIIADGRLKIRMLFACIILHLAVLIQYHTG